MRLSSVKIILCLISLIGLLSLAACVRLEQGCTDLNALNYNPDAFKDDGSCVYVIDTPQLYDFYRYWESSVDISQERLQLLLMNDFRSSLYQLGQAGATYDSTALWSLFYDGSPDFSPLINGDLPLLQSDYNELSSTNNSLSLLDNVDSSVDAIISNYIEIILSRISSGSIGTNTVYISDEGIDMAQHIYSLQLATIAYLNAANELNNLSTYSSSISSNENYSAQENALDRAFAYMGPAIGALNLTDENIASLNSFEDTDQDGFIDLSKEWNCSFFPLAAARDISDNSGSTEANTNFTDDLLQAFINTRTAITNQNDTLTEQGIGRLQSLTQQIIAANTLHFSNRLYNALNSSTIDLNESIAAWQELSVYVGMFNYNSESLFTEASIYQEAVGYTLPDFTSTAFDKATYLTELQNLKSALQSAYDFTQAQVDGF